MNSQTVTCVGAVHWDTVAQVTHPLRKGGDVPGFVRRAPGGVAFNIATGLAKRGVRTRLVAAVGGDTDGDVLLNIARLSGVETDHVQRISHAGTDQFVALEDTNGELFGAVADTSTLDNVADTLFHSFEGRPIGGIILLDANLPQRVIDMLASSTMLRGADLRLVSASPAKAPRLRGLTQMAGGTVYANLAEANAMLDGAYSDAASAARAFCAQGANGALVTAGPRTAAWATATQTITAAPPPVVGRSTNGAGDALVAGHIAAQLSRRSAWEALQAGLRAAAEKMQAGRER